MGAIDAVTTTGETAALCHSVGLARATLYRRRQSARPSTTVRAPSARALVPAERQVVLDVLHSKRFVDQSPAEVQATLLEEQTYLCSTRTMYRILADAHEVRERRDQARHPAYAKPELVAMAPNQIWSWDITQLKGPIPYLYYSLYVILDLFSRYVVGWMVAAHENARLAQRLIDATCRKQGIGPNQLTIHADRGAPMRSKLVAELFSDLSIDASHSRPRVSNDNPFSEAQFRTFKYRPEFPDRFGSLEHGRTVSRDLFAWYNDAHHHSGLSYLTPADVHYGRAAATLGPVTARA
jgi:putative transposase